MLVNPIGPSDAKIVIIGESPGEEEDRSGIPFVGRSGQLLNCLLATIGLTRSDVYITNVVKVKPPNNSMDRVDETGKTLEQWTKELREELNQLSPNVIVPFGNTALNAICNVSSITKYRGSILHYYKTPTFLIKVIPTFHPSALLRQYGWTMYSYLDFQKIKSESEFSDTIEPVRTFHLNPSYDFTIEYLQNLSSYDRVAVDIETPRKGLKYIKCISFSPFNYMGGYNAICIPFIHGGKPVWSQAEEVEIWRHIQQLLTNPSVGKVIQNMMFEYLVLYPWVGDISPIVADTMIIQKLINPEMEKGLDTICSIYTTIPYYKEDAKDSDYEGEGLWKYNCLDTMALVEALPIMDDLLHKYNMYDFYYQYIQKFALIMARASHAGMKVSSERLSYYKGETERAIDEKSAHLKSIIGYDINVKSDKQVKDLIYTKYKLPYLKAASGVGKVDEETLSVFIRRYPNLAVALQLILDIRGLRTLISTFLCDIADTDGRVRTSWIVGGTETGRLASRKNVFDTGCNMQNIPKNIRDIFVADDGYILVKGDMSQVEARIVGYLSRDVGLVNIFDSGGDIHSEVTSWVYNIPVSEVPKDKRNTVKHVVHGANYDIGPRTFARKIGISESEGKWLLAQFHKVFPGVRRFHKEIENKLATQDRTLTTPFGRRRKFFGWWGDNLFREAIAYLPQSTAVDIINQAAVRIDSRLPNGAIILLQVHDELVIQCKESDVNTVATIMKEEVEKPIQINGRDVIIPIEIATGKDWKNTNEWKLSEVK